MPEITVTESQQETLETVKADLEGAYIDTYGQIRTTDVVQYLLDTYTPPEKQHTDAAHERIATAEFPLLQKVAADVGGVPGSGIDTETMRGELLSALGVEEFASRLAEFDAPTADDPEEGTSGVGDEQAGEQDESEGEEPSAASDDAAGDADSEDSDDSSGSTPAAGAPGGGGDSDAVLSAANQLLNTHDGKWRKGSGEEPYEVDLPDGSTADVRTKDDVKQLLFKHY